MDKRCHKCKQRGHLARYCIYNFDHYVVKDELYIVESILEISVKIASNNHKPLVQVMILKDRHVTLNRMFNTESWTKCKHQKYVIIEGKYTITTLFNTINNQHSVTVHVDRKDINIHTKIINFNDK